MFSPLERQPRQPQGHCLPLPPSPLGTGWLRGSFNTVTCLFLKQNSQKGQAGLCVLHRRGSWELVHRASKGSGVRGQGETPSAPGSPSIPQFTYLHLLVHPGAGPAPPCSRLGGPTVTFHEVWTQQEYLGGECYTSIRLGPIGVW